MPQRRLHVFHHTSQLQARFREQVQLHKQWTKPNPSTCLHEVWLVMHRYKERTLKQKKRRVNAQQHRTIRAQITDAIRVCLFHAQQSDLLHIVSSNPSENALLGPSKRHPCWSITWRLLQQIQRTHVHESWIHVRWVAQLMSREIWAFHEPASFCTKTVSPRWMQPMRCYWHLVVVVDRTCSFQMHMIPFLPPEHWQQ